jgi:hypothetical protein
MPYKNGKVDMAGYGAKTSTMKPVMKESSKEKLVKQIAKNKAAKKRGMR